MRFLALVLALVGAWPGATRPAAAASARKDAEAARSACLDKLDELGVRYRRAAPRRGIAIPVEVTGPLGGVSYEARGGRSLILDCSLVYSLAWAGRFFSEAGVSAVRYSSAYQRRNIRGTRRPSKHSFGLAIDIHAFRTEAGDLISVESDYEQGLGEDADCLGAPLTDAGAALRLFYCRLERSGLFRVVLTPDYDPDHYNHFHIEVLPWKGRRDLDWPRSAQRAHAPMRQ